MAEAGATPLPGRKKKKAFAIAPISVDADEIGEIVRAAKQVRLLVIQKEGGGGMTGKGLEDKKTRQNVAAAMRAIEAGRYESFGAYPCSVVPMGEAPVGAGGCLARGGRRPAPAIGTQARRACSCWARSGSG